MGKNARSCWLWLLLLWAANATLAQTDPHGPALFSNLGCANCHAGLADPPQLKQLIPDLSSAGLRYQPAWLFEFLQNPVRLRKHIGPARMPDFNLSPAETVALVRFLETQKTVPGQWPPLPEAVTKPPAADTPLASEADRLLCLTCHSANAQGGQRAVDLSNTFARLRPDWVRSFLVAPEMFGVHPTNMPPQFYRPAADNAAFEPLTPEAPDRIHRLQVYLESLTTGAADAFGKRWDTAQQDHPDAHAGQGRQLFQALNCAACHRHHTIEPKPIGGPDLTIEGSRVQQSWLDQYLDRPTPIRPFGHQPGGGGRMPDFKLSKEEREALSQFLGDQKRVTPQAGAAPKRSTWSRRKARRLLDTQLSCLGCHRWNGSGGRIGPDLSLARIRLKPDYLLQIIADPRSLAPHSVMPHSPMKPETAAAVADLLYQNISRISGTNYLSVLDHPPLLDAPTNQGARLYQHYCAMCHGATGNGDGFNARYLPVKPTRHADAAYLSRRPDDTLFDGIHAGGRVLNRSHHMPAWGKTLNSRDIESLVSHLRALCNCEGPAWSKDP